MSKAATFPTLATYDRAIRERTDKVYVDQLERNAVGPLLDRIESAFLRIVRDRKPRFNQKPIDPKVHFERRALEFAIHIYGAERPAGFTARVTGQRKLNTAAGPSHHVVWHVDCPGVNTKTWLGPTGLRDITSHLIRWFASHMDLPS